MHGLIIRSFENFIRDTYGIELWEAVMYELDLGFFSFEPMFQYEIGTARALLETCARRLDKPRDEMLEDWGTYLVAHSASERVRRLLRFGGVDYEDFLASLEDLPGRARLAVSDLELPDMAIDDLGPGAFELTCTSDVPEAAPVLLGLLRALADDYGALVFIEHSGRSAGTDRLSIQLLASDFAEGRGFALSQSGHQ